MQDFGSGDTSSNLVGGMQIKVRILLQPIFLVLLLFWYISPPYFEKPYLNIENLNFRVEIQQARE
jgi:hypothetical protein